MSRRILSAILTGALLGGCTSPVQIPDRKIVRELSIDELVFKELIEMENFLEGKKLLKNYKTGGTTVLFTSYGSIDYRPQTNIAVLLIDMQNQFVDKLDPEEKRREIPKQASTLLFAAHFGIPIYVLELEGKGDTTNLLTERLEWIRDYTSVTYITKKYNDGFVETNLGRELKSKGTENLLLMGVNACACVFETAENAERRGFTIMTSKELIADGTNLNYYGERLDWYKKHAVYEDKYKDLLRIMTSTRFAQKK